MQELPKHAHLKARNENLQDAFKKQRVFFSNPRGEVTEAELKRLCEASGLSYHGTRIDPHDWWSRDARKDMINGHGVAVSKLALGGSFMAYAGLPYVEKFLDSASTSVAGAATLVGTGIGAYVVLKSTATKNLEYIKHMPKIWNSSMGKGHLSWD